MDDVIDISELLEARRLLSEALGYLRDYQIEAASKDEAGNLPTFDATLTRVRNLADLCDQIRRHLDR